ncbi:MAG TPA: hypothetical protein VJN93_08710 [Candidatus Acidoferrum sp.]|nr:hypothetical protein [Candidatus Acidoferrum sp.]
MEQASGETQAVEAKITLRRDAEDDAQERQIVVKLNGERKGELMFGDTMTIPVKAGQHRLTVDNTWNWKTLELDVKAGEHIRFRTMSRVGKFTWFLVSLFGAGPMYVSIEREE